MRRLELEAELTIESGGRRIRVESANGWLVARCSSLGGLISFARRFWRFRRYVPEGIRMAVEWRGLRVGVGRGGGRRG
jgi:hypothetical protein